ncbi:NADPH-dependent FMN reductase [Solitalea canadensis]|uniref:Putative flavoprotein n=1 Tax=Solitalea canadensis (strain ATCC 29591 / DSM 3403 / JCM 21819 / LMG 8368 / NBRC 15130 / NCIMB 12057 / USAM 9D) TaxID=929556 RepID=H8KMN7_SOLCM|nr:NAD(P)H-dependent oxidoreductase [Solitalea canadensis]AFD09028.1 putative flavoprotein [Solitalea canadensis DSM 3403]
MHIVIISSSVRIGRNSHRVALYFKNYITENKLATVEILDLNEYKFPVFDERLRFMKDPSPQILQFTDKIKAADGVIIVTPEYNGGYPAALKNVIDLLYDEWKRKPLALATASAGPFGGAQVTTSLVFTLWKIGFWLVPAMFAVPKVQDSYDENGVPVNKELTDKLAKGFIGELIWCMEAKKRMHE